MNGSMIDLDILLPALLAGLLVTATHIPLGQRVLQRGIIFLDLAVAQIAGFGIILAYSLHFAPGGWQVQFIALSAAIAGVLILHYTEHRWPDIQEALIGSLFVLTSSGSILLLAASPQGGEQLRELLVGQILWVSYQQLVPIAIIYAAIIAFWFFLARQRSSLYFYLVFALTITLSVQLVGVYLVFASLIFPALAMRKLNSFRISTGYFIGAGGYLMGLMVAAILDLPAGAVIVLSLAALALVVGIIRSRQQAAGN